MRLETHSQYRKILAQTSLDYCKFKFRYHRANSERAKISWPTSTTTLVSDCCCLLPICLVVRISSLQTERQKTYVEVTGYFLSSPSQNMEWSIVVNEYSPSSKLCLEMMCNVVFCAFLCFFSCIYRLHH